MQKSATHLLFSVDLWYFFLGQQVLPYMSCLQITVTILSLSEVETIQELGIYLLAIFIDFSVHED